MYMLCTFKILLVNCNALVYNLNVSSICLSNVFLNLNLKVDVQLWHVG